MNEKGFIPVLVLVAALGIGTLATSFIPVPRIYNDGKSYVLGIGDHPGLMKAALDSIGAEERLRIISDQGQTALTSSTSGAISNFPLNINTEDNTLTVTTPAGTKTVTVLPDQAIKNLQASYVLDDVISEEAQGALGSVERLVRLEERDGVLGYLVSGFRKHEIFGLSVFKTKVEAFVSAENGQVVSTSQSLLGRILNKIAP